MTALLLSGGAGTHKPDWFCIDAAGMKTTTNYVPVWERGFRGMSGYIGGRYDIPDACIRAWWELPDTWWMINYELNAAAGLGGATVGTAYAKDAIRRIRDKGHLRETALIFSLVDFGPTASQFPILDETHRAVIDVCMADGQMPGFYGPPVYLRHLAVMEWVPVGTVFWQWGGGGAPEWWTTVKQAGPSSKPPVAHDLTGFGFAADENLLWAPMHAWTGYGTTPPQPSNGAHDMRWFFLNSEDFPAFTNDAGQQLTGPNADGSWPASWLRFEVDPRGGKRHISGDEWSAMFPGGVIPPDIGTLDSWTTGRIQQMPNVHHDTAASTAPVLVPHTHEGSTSGPAVPG